MIIGGKTKKPTKPSQPQFVVERSQHSNEFMLFGTDEDQQPTISWIGDPNAASKFESKYAAKCRVRDLQDIPHGRVIRPLHIERGARA